MTLLNRVTSWHRSLILLYMERDGSDLARVVRRTGATLNPEHYSLLMQIESLQREIGEGLARLAQLENQPVQIRRNVKRRAK